jgi:cell division protein FtsQ
LTARSQARQRRKQHAPARPGRVVRGNAKRGTSKGGAVRRAPRGAPAGQRERAAGVRDRLLGRARALAAQARARAQLATETEPEAPRVWPRRLGVAALKLCSVLAVAWALVIAGREVYEYSTTSPRFEVQHLIYEPTAHVDDEALRALLAIEPGTNILACDLAALSERVAAHPWVAQATVTRNLPDTLEVAVVEHTPAAIVLAERFYLVDGEGRPFKPVEQGERGTLPIITGIERAQLAEQREAAVAQIAGALELIHLYAAKQRPRLGELHLGDDGSITLYTAEAGTALHLGRGEFAARLGRWDALRAALGERADRLAVVHLDHESKPDRRDRVVARFADERDGAVLLAAADMLDHDPQDSPSAIADQAAAPRSPARRAGQRKRIPSYE